MSKKEIERIHHIYNQNIKLREENRQLRKIVRDQQNGIMSTAVKEYSELLTTIQALKIECAELSQEIAFMRRKYNKEVEKMSNSPSDGNSIKL